MKEIRVLYFAQLRGARGVTEEEYRTAAGNPQELYRELSVRYDFTLEFEQLRVAVNHAGAPADASLGDGDVVAFLPPVSGG